MAAVAPGLAGVLGGCVCEFEDGVRISARGAAAAVAKVCIVGVASLN